MRRAKKKKTYENVNTAYRMRDGRFDSNTLSALYEERMKRKKKKKKVRANIIKRAGADGEKNHFRRQTSAPRRVSARRSGISAGKTVCAARVSNARAADIRAESRAQRFAVAVNGHDQCGAVERKHDANNMT